MQEPELNPLTAVPEINRHQFRAAIEFLFGKWGGQRTFARLSGIHETTVRRYVSGARAIPPTVVLLLAYQYERWNQGFDPSIDAGGLIGRFMEEVTPVAAGQFIPAIKPSAEDRLTASSRPVRASKVEIRSEGG
jgi:hypothetical protein